MLLKHLQETIERTFGPGRYQHFRASSALVGDMRNSLVEKIDACLTVLALLGFRRPSRADMGVEFEDLAHGCLGLGERRQPQRTGMVERDREFLLIEIERVRRHGLVGRCLNALPLGLRQLLVAGLVIIDDLLAAFARGFDCHMVGDDAKTVEIVEDGFKPLVEKRQPMFHAGKAAPLGDRCIERVVTGRRAELAQIIGTKAADGFGIERNLAHGVEPELLHLAGRAL